MTESASPSHDSRTVFVRGLDAAVTDDILSSTFSAIGPVKHAFLVKKRAAPGAIQLTTHHKGFGFVQFALEEDAVRAVYEMNGTRLQGRVMKVEGAKKRASFEARKEQKLAEKAPPAVDTENAVAGDGGGDDPVPSPTSLQASKKKSRPTRTTEQLEKSKLKHNLVKTVAVGGLGVEDVEGAIALAKSLKVAIGKASNTKESAKSKKKAKKLQEKDAGAEEAGGKGGDVVTRTLEVADVVYPVPSEMQRQYRLEQDGCSGEVFMVQYASVKDALAAVRLLHGQQRTFRAAAGKRKSGKGAHTAVIWARQVSGDGLYLKKHRVVVRNMPFDATEGDVRGAFGDFMLWEVTLPRGIDGNARGFAFVGFVCRQDAERAIEKVNATKIRGRTVAVDWAVSKREFEDEKQRKETGKAGQVHVEKNEKNEKKQRRLDQVEGGDGDVRPGQELESGSEEDIDLNQEKSRVNNVLDSILGGGDDYFEEIEDSDDGKDGSDDDADGDSRDSGDSSDSGDSGDSSDTDQPPASSDAPDPPQNGPAGDANENSAVEKLNEQAKRMEASLAKASAKEPYTVEPGATVFIRNIPIEATQKTVFEAMKKFGFVKSTRLVINKRTQRPKGTAFVDFRSAEDAARAAQASQKAAEKSGPPVFIAGKPVDIHIALGTDDARDLAVRKSKDFAANANPDKGRNLYLAQEGLIAEGSAAWNSLSSSDKEKRARAATESEMKLKSPNFAVSTTRLNVRNVPKSWDEGKIKSLFIKAVKNRATKENPKVAQVKILTNPSGVSKGIAFVEFKQHDHALCALRELNNNPETWSKDHRPIVEFAIDNVQALKKRSMNQLKQRDSLAGNNGDKSAPETTKAKKKKKPDADETETKSKRKLRMERRQMLKQKNRNANNKPPNKEASNGAENKEVPAKAGKSARRREQRRKRELDMAVDGLAKTGVAPVASKAQKKRKSDTSVEAQVERKLSASGQKKKSAETRWFD